MKRSLVLAVVAVFLVFIFNAFAINPDKPVSNLDGPAPTIKIDVSVPSCKVINIAIFDFDMGLDLKSFKVDGKNIKGSSVSFKTSQPRKVEFKVRGIGLIAMQTDTGFQWICLVIKDEYYPLTFPPIP